MGLAGLDRFRPRSLIMALAGLAMFGMGVSTGWRARALAKRLAAEWGPPRCRQCGYDLRGSLAGRCPECGAPWTTAPDAEPPSPAARPPATRGT